ncbi:hypothetical protein XI03_20350 [Bradyrhizobium sp. CCBAU 65884]|nr:hypothetical protein [Bradyrhizobium sp. CCBAU 65884]
MIVAEIQIQQVALSLIRNSIEAMASLPSPRIDVPVVRSIGLPLLIGDPASALRRAPVPTLCHD